MDFMEYRLSKFKNDIANQFRHNVFYNNVLIRVFYYLSEKRINTRILFLMTTYRRVLPLMAIRIESTKPSPDDTIEHLDTAVKLQLLIVCSSNNHYVRVQLRWFSN